MRVTGIRPALDRPLAAKAGIIGLWLRGTQGNVCLEGSAMKEPLLPERVMNMLLSSEYARLVSRSPSDRLGCIVDIVSLHTKDELVRKPGLGRGSVRQIETWLSFHGRRLRRSSESIDSVICKFEFRKRRRRRSSATNATATEAVGEPGRDAAQSYSEL